MQGNVSNATQNPTSPVVQYVIRSLSESDVDLDGDAGAFWSNVDGWGSFQAATLFSTKERMSFNLPMSAKLDAEWMLVEEARELDANRKMSNYIEQTALSQDKPAGLRALNCAASLSNGLLTLEDGTSVELADLVDYVKGVASKVIPSSNDAEHDLLVEVIGEAGAVLNQSGVRRILSNYIDHPASGKTGTFAAKYDQHAERNGQSFTVLGAVDPSTYDADECGEMFTIRFADGVQIDAWPEEVESARVAQSPVDRLCQYGHNPT